MTEMVNHECILHGNEKANIQQLQWLCFITQQDRQGTLGRLSQEDLKLKYNQTKRPCFQLITVVVMIIIIMPYGLKYTHNTSWWVIFRLEFWIFISTFKALELIGGKSLPGKHQDLSSMPSLTRTHVKKSGKACDYHLSSGKAEAGGS